MQILIKETKKRKKQKTKNKIGNKQKCTFNGKISSRLQHVFIWEMYAHLMVVSPNPFFLFLLFHENVFLYFILIIRVLFSFFFLLKNEIRKFQNIFFFLSIVTNFILFYFCFFCFSSNFLEINGVEWKNNCT